MSGSLQASLLADCDDHRQRYGLSMKCSSNTSVPDSVWHLLHFTYMARPVTDHQIQCCQRLSTHNFMQRSTTQQIHKHTHFDNIHGLYITTVPHPALLNTVGWNTPDALRYTTYLTKLKLSAVGHIVQLLFCRSRLAGRQVTWGIASKGSCILAGIDSSKVGCMLRVDMLLQHS